MQSRTVGFLGVVIAVLAAACGGGGVSDSMLVGPSGVNGSTAPSRIDGGCAVPDTPSRVAVRVQDGKAVLTWAAVEDTADYIVIAGTTPGAADAVFTNTLETSYVMGGLGPGRYYARIHAHNWCGTSDPSPEVEFAID